MSSQIKCHDLSCKNNTDGECKKRFIEMVLANHFDDRKLKCNGRE